jgi:hypothetical protein
VCVRERNREKKGVCQFRVSVDGVPKNCGEISLLDAQLRPVVTYGAETWTMTKKKEKALLLFERKIFRRIYGPKYEDGEWKSRMNRGLEELNKGENIVKWIKGQRISRLDHL